MKPVPDTALYRLGLRHPPVDAFGRHRTLQSTVLDINAEKLKNSGRGSQLVSLGSVPRQPGDKCARLLRRRRRQNLWHWLGRYGGQYRWRKNGGWRLYIDKRRLSPIWQRFRFGRVPQFIEGESHRQPNAPLP